MWKGSSIMFRTLKKRQMLIENRICSHCLSTTIPPSITKSRVHPVFQPLPLSSHHLMPPVVFNQVQSISDFSNLRDLRQHPEYFSSSSVSGQKLIPEEDKKPIPADSQDDGISKSRANRFIGLDTEFPCVIKKSRSGPEPSYDLTTEGFEIYHHQSPFHLKHRSGVLPELKIAYETWGTLNKDRDNAILLHCGLSASSHAKSHPDNPNPGWWEKFIGPGCPLDTNKYFIICTNNLGSCYGTTGPSSTNPLSGKPYATKFPIISVEDIVESQFLLLDHLNIDKLYGCVGSSLGGMQSVTSAVLYPDRVSRVVAISSTARSYPSSIAMRYLQRKAIMTDPDWQNGYYYNSDRYPKTGMKIAREIATLTYRSGPEWDQRFGRTRIDDNEQPSLCPNFVIENYLEYQGEIFVYKLDPNSLIYISKAMDLFDLSEMFDSMHAALCRVQCPVMIIGVQTDILFPVWQQRELAKALQAAGNTKVTYYELNSIYGHDTFLLDLNGVGAGVKGFLETNGHNIK